MGAPPALRTPWSTLADTAGEPSQVRSVTASPHAIEVQSPGENRLLLSERDFERFRGEGVVVRLGAEAGPRRTLYGVLLECDDGKLRLTERDSRSEMSFDLAGVMEVRLHPK